jgi:hypothetical protein
MHLALHTVNSHLAGGATQGPFGHDCTAPTPAQTGGSERDDRLGGGANASPAGGGGLCWVCWHRGRCPPAGGGLPLGSTLAYTHRKERVRWIEDAKKPETRATRLTRCPTLRQTHPDQHTQPVFRWMFGLRIRLRWSGLQNASGMPALLLPEVNDEGVAQLSIEQLLGSPLVDPPRGLDLDGCSSTHRCSTSYRPSLCSVLKTRRCSLSMGITGWPPRKRRGEQRSTLTSERAPGPMRSSSRQMSRCASEASRTSRLGRRSTATAVRAGQPRIVDARTSRRAFGVWSWYKLQPSQAATCRTQALCTNGRRHAPALGAVGGRRPPLR